ncbi:MAG: L-threonylcarbamoyladenylate synthase [Thermomicrobiales bacterium]
MAASTPTLLKADAEGIAAAIAVLQSGGIIAAPTDTVYGIAASLQQPAALQRLFLAKGRDAAKAIPVLLADAAGAETLADDPSQLATLAASFWPGALTIVVTARAGLPAEILTPDANGTPTVALRVPDNAIMRALCRASGGALAVTSANRSGLPPATSAREVIEAGLPDLAAVVDGGQTPGAVPSTIVALRGGDVALIREGIIPYANVTDIATAGHAVEPQRGMISR